MSPTSLVFPAARLQPISQSWVQGPLSQMTARLIVEFHVDQLRGLYRIGPVRQNPIEK